VISVNRNIVGYIKYLLINIVVCFSYCYGYRDFVKTSESCYWFVLYALLFLEHLIALRLSRYKYRSDYLLCGWRTRVDSLNLFTLWVTALDTLLSA